MRFVLIDETIVSYGYWVKISGANLKQFKRNPIMLWMHQRASRWDGQNQVLPIGYWKDIKVETINGVKSITAEPVFDEKDEFAMQIKSKVDAGVLKMASSGLQPIAWSDAKEDLKPGQTRATVTKWEMKEASIVDLGANKNAIRLYNEDQVINLSDDTILNYIPKVNFNSNTDMKLIALKLGLSESATENEILAKIQELQESEKENSDKVKKLNAERVERLMKHESITDENEAHFRELAETNIGLAEKTLDLMASKETKTTQKPQTERLSDVIKRKQTDTGAGEKKWADYTDEELVDLRENKIELYETLYEAEFNIKPVIEK